MQIKYSQMWQFLDTPHSFLIADTILSAMAIFMVYLKYNI